MHGTMRCATMFVSDTVVSNGKARQHHVINIFDQKLSLFYRLAVCVLPESANALGNSLCNHVCRTQFLSHDKVRQHHFPSIFSTKSCRDFTDWRCAFSNRQRHWTILCANMCVSDTVFVPRQGATTPFPSIFSTKSCRDFTDWRCAFFLNRQMHWTIRMGKCTPKRVP